MTLAALLMIVTAVESFWPAALRRPDGALNFTRLEADFGIIRILPEFAFGMAIAMIGQLSGKTGLILTSAGLAGMGTAILLRSDLAFVLAGAAFIAGLMQWNWTPHRWLLWLGRASYSLYMTHALVQIVGFKLLERAGGYSDGAVPAAYLIPMVALSLCVAGLMYSGVELPARRWCMARFEKSRTARRQSAPATTGQKRARSFSM